MKIIFSDLLSRLRTLLYNYFLESKTKKRHYIDTVKNYQQDSYNFNNQ